MKDDPAITIIIIAVVIGGSWLLAKGFVWIGSAAVGAWLGVN